GRQSDPRGVAALLVEIEAAEGEVDDLEDLTGEAKLLAELMVEDAIGLERRRQRRPVARRIISVELAIAGDRGQGEIVAEFDIEVGGDAPAVDRAGQRRLPRRAAVARR